MPTVSFTGVKSCTAADDAIDVVFKTRYSGDLAVKMTRTCLGELVAALAGSSEMMAPAEEKKAPAGTAAKGKPTPTAQATSQETAAAFEPSAAATDEPVSADGIRFKVPKRWAVAAETRDHNLVLVLFDPQTERQSLFAISPSTATDMADALVKKAKIVRDHVDRKSTTSS